MDFQDSLWDISVSRLVILAESFFEMSCRKTNTQSNGSENPTVGVGVYSALMISCLSLSAVKCVTYCQGSRHLIQNDGHQCHLRSLYASVQLQFNSNSNT